ncbi:MoaD/ThiS family protein [Myxococcus stipitatus]|uniref:ubiquitin-like small modifier protein 1 n=1 Tax=Myxococcus stipitatus TaxID=83455 RepID=UPI001F45F250|nr:ubiquitin-like small modifier protein 1 [Myxococcus stipitatus]MCE9670300.1 MoaD/ThiS family protein [Myxococcus stipitatus]
MATIRIPTTMRALTRNQAEVVAMGATVREVLKDLDARYPGLGARLLDERGAVRRYVNVFLNDEDIRALADLDTPVRDADRLTLIPAMAGG